MIGGTPGGDDLRKIIHDELQAALRSHASPWKNGESWWQWVTRNVTPERILLVAMFLVTIGARAQRLESVSTEALATAQATAETNARLSGELEAMRKIIDAQATAIATGEQQHATRADVNAMRESIRLLVTRDEMRAVLRQELLPRLQRIEESRNP